MFNMYYEIFRIQISPTINTDLASHHTYRFCMIKDKHLLYKIRDTITATDLFAKDQRKIQQVSSIVSNKKRCD